MKLSEATTMFLESRFGVIAPRTLTLYRATLDSLVQVLEDPRLDQVTTYHLRQFRNYHLSRDVTQATAHRYTREARTFFFWLEDEGLIERNPARRLELPRQDETDPKAAAVSDIKRAVAWLDGHQAQGTEPAAALCRMRLALFFLVDTGARVGALRDLLIADIHDDHAIVTTKGRGGRRRQRVYLQPPTQAAIQDWLLYRPDSNHDNLMLSLFGKRRGKPVKHSALSHIFRRIKREVGIKGPFNPHSFRHAAAREWLRNGADLASVSQLLGHSGIGVTAKHYARWAANELADIHQRVSYVGELMEV